MTYFSFLAWFLGIPLAVFAGITVRDSRRGLRLPSALAVWPFAWVVAAHVILAVVYTTPWDNYLVATGVWYYDPQLVSGIVFGWVPIEEYTFFVLQTILTSLVLLSVARRWRGPSGQTVPGRRPVAPYAGKLRFWSAALTGGVWATSAAVFASGWLPGVYLALILVWALPPVIFQLAFGADIIWRYRWIVLWTLLPIWLYLCLGDGLAIKSGTWTIDLAQSTGIMIGSLPLEEAVFFLATNVLIVFGAVLVLARESLQRVPDALVLWLRRIVPANQKASVTNV